MLRPHIEKHVDCPLCNYFGERELCQRWENGLSVKRPTETHHIAFGKTRIQTPENEIRICQGCHAWVHQHSTDGKFLCLHAMADSGQLTPEALEVLDHCFGNGGKVIGWLQSKRSWIDPRFKEHADALVEFIENGCAVIEGITREVAF